VLCKILLHSSGVKLCLFAMATSTDYNGVLATNFSETRC
jgi:hypothetical protein